MQWRTFMIGWTLALGVLLICHSKPAADNHDVGTAVVELTYANAPHAVATRGPVPAGHPQRIVAPLVILDVTNHTRSDSRYVVSMDDVAHWEETHGHMPPNAVVMAHTEALTAWHSHPNRGERAGNAGRFPGFSEDAIRFLVEARQAYGLGTETPQSGRSVVLVYRAPTINAAWRAAIP